MNAFRPGRRTLLAGGLGALAVGAFPGVASAAAPPARATSASASAVQAPLQLTLAGPTGPARVGTVSLHLVDRSRANPWTGGPDRRELMISLTYPARDTGRFPRAPWMAPAVAESWCGRYGVPTSAVAFPLTHSAEGAPVAWGARHLPVVVHTPGYQANRTFSTLVVEELASRGYLVVTVDHPYDSGEVEFPDGRVVVTTDVVPPGPDPVAIRAADLKFVLDCLHVLNRGGNPDAGRRRLPHGLRGAFDLSCTGIFGHSRGGGTTAAAMQLDRRYRAGLNLDGTPPDAVAAAGLGRPHLILVDTMSPVEPAQRALWQNLRGWRRFLRTDDSGHLTFTDMKSIIAQLSPGGTSMPVGAIPVDRAIATTRAVNLAFFDEHLRHRRDRSGILDGRDRRNPEIKSITP